MTPGVDSDAVAQQISALLDDANLPSKKVQDLNDRAFRSYAEQALADDILSEGEEAHLREVGLLLGVDQEAFRTRHGDLLERLAVAQINDGRLPEMDDPIILAHKDEIVHAETEAAILETVTVKERTGGGYHGLSIPLGKGFRYHVGGARGSVSSRSELQAVDAGILSVTSDRVLFTGNQKTLEIPYRRLVRMKVFTDAIQFHMTGRKSAPLIQMGPVDAIAATVGAAAAKKG